MTEVEKTAIEVFEERAAIHEMDGGLFRANAESMALQEVLRRYGQAVGQTVQRYRESRRNA